MDLIQELDCGNRLLEVGCLPGHLTLLPKGSAYDVEGVDIDPGRMQPLWDKYGICPLKVDVERETLPFDDGSFDVVLFTEMLEHLRVNPVFTLRELNRVLRSGGWLILCTPNITPMHRLRFLMGKDFQGDPVEEFGKLERLGHMGHIRLYSPEEITRMLEHTGFSIERTFFDGASDVAGKGKIFYMLHPRKREFGRFIYVLGRKE
jgi:SAM-dependent methyltransferase